MRILVIGGAGYIGSITSAALVRKGHEVIVFDNLSRGHKEAVPKEAKLIVGDLANQEHIDEALALRPDVVMHFAALIEVGESVKNPSLYFANNLTNSLRLLDSMLAHNIGKIVFSSTAAVYGEPPASPIDESFPLAPTSPYGDSKLAVEKVLSSYSTAYPFSYVSLRYFNASGATDERGEDHHPESHLIPNVLMVARGQKEKAIIFGDDYPTPDGTCVRDYIHVSDLADAHLAAAEHLEKGGDSRIYNLGSETGFSVKQVVEEARAVTGHPIPVQFNQRRAGDPAILVASSSRIKSELGWNPKRTKLRDIIADAWKWHSSKPNGYSREKTPV